MADPGQKVGTLAIQSTETFAQIVSQESIDVKMDMVPRMLNKANKNEPFDTKNQYQNQSQIRASSELRKDLTSGKYVNNFSQSSASTIQKKTQMQTQ